MKKLILLLFIPLISFSSFGQSRNFNSENDIKEWINQFSKDEIEGIWVFTSENLDTGKQRVYLKAAILNSNEHFSEKGSFQEIYIECYDNFYEHCKSQDWGLGHISREIKKQGDGFYEFLNPGGFPSGLARLNKNNMSINYDGFIVSAVKVYPKEK